MDRVTPQAAHAPAPGPETPQRAVGDTLNETRSRMHVHRRFHLRRDCTTIPVHHRRHRARRGLKILGLLTGVATAGLLASLIVTDLIIGLIALAFGY